MKDQSIQPPPAGSSAELNTAHIRKYKFFNIVVNGRIMLFDEKKISYSGIVALAFNAAAAKKSESFRVSFKKGGGKNPAGVLKKDDFVAASPGMVFTVEPAGKY